jgi:Mn2+/Fe2+ NRAMP family transporter
VSVPVMVVMMLIARSSKVMGTFAVTGALSYVGWTATGAMAVASFGMLLTTLF